VARYALHEDYHDTIRPALVAAGRLIEELCGAEMSIAFSVNPEPGARRPAAFQHGPVST